MNRALAPLLITLSACALAGCPGGSQSTDAQAGNDGALEAGGDSGIPDSDSGGARDAGGNGGTDAGTITPDSGNGGTDAGTVSDGGTTGSGRWISGYYVGYQRDLYPVDQVDFAALTHVMIGRVTPQPDGSLNTTFDIDPTNGPAMARDLVTRAHAAGKKAVVMLGGAGEHDGWVGAASDANRAAFVRNLAALATDYGFDGFDVDWEPLDATEQPTVEALVRELRAAVPGTLVTIPVGWVNANFPDVDGWYGTAAPLFDQINIMSYGMAGSWDGWDSWHSSALHGGPGSTPSSVESSVDAYLAAGVPAAKLGVGAGFYGSCWDGVTGPGQSTAGATLVADDNTMSFTNIMASYFAQADYSYDATAEAPYLHYASAHGPQGCTFVSYEDERSLTAKGDFVRARGLGGVIIWTINEGYLPTAPAGQRDPLLEALRQSVMP